MAFKKKINKKPVKKTGEKKSGPACVKVSKDEEANNKNIIILPESRLARVLNKIPHLKLDGENVDIEEYLVTKWREKAEKSQIGLFLSAVKSGVNNLDGWMKKQLGNWRDYGHIAFPYPNSLYTIGEKTVLAKKETLSMIKARPAVVKLATLCLMALIVAAAVVRFLPSPAGKYLTMADKFFLAPFYVISQNNVSFLRESMFGLNKPARQPLPSTRPAQIDQDFFAGFIADHAGELVSLRAAGQNTYIIRLDDLKGRAAGAAEMAANQPKTVKESGLMETVREDAGILLAMIGRWIEKIVK